MSQLNMSKHSNRPLVHPDLDPDNGKHEIWCSTCACLAGYSDNPDAYSDYCAMCCHLIEQE